MSTYSASRKPCDTAQSGWYALLPPPGPPRTLSGEGRADWIVVGGGFAGLFAAWRLRQLQPHDRIVVLEAQRIAWGAAGRNSGFMIDLPHELNSGSYGGVTAHDLKLIRMNRAGIAIARAVSEEAGLMAYFNPCGKYHGAAGPRGLSALKSFETHLRILREPFTTLSKDDMRRITGTDFYAGGTFTPGAVILQPAAFVRNLALHLSAKVDIFENSPVVRIETGAMHTIQTPEGSISAPRLIMANNGHLESFGYFKGQLLHIFTYASMTRELTDGEIRSLGGEPEWALIPADPMGTTLRRIKEGRIVVRNTFTYNPDMKTDAAQIARISARHDRSFASRFPMLKDAQMEYRWGGHLCLSLNSAPAFGEVEDRIFAAGCCNGLGTVKSTLAGYLIAELACGHKSARLDDQLSEPAPQPLYPEPLMTIGANAKLWWMQRRAGADL